MKWIIVLMMLISSLHADDDHHRFPMDLHDLGLSKQQYHSVKEVMKEYQYAYRRYHHQREKVQEEVNGLFLNPTFDSESFRTKNLELEKASIEIRAHLMEQLHSVLTLEQKRRFISHLEEWDSD